MRVAMNSRVLLIIMCSAAATSAHLALAQDKGTLDPKPLPPLTNPNDPHINAKELFGRETLPAPLAVRSIGFYGHDYHFHVRIKCPSGSSECQSQPPPSENEGCSAGDLAYWFSEPVLHPKLSTTPVKPGRAMTLAELPAACRQILVAP